MHVDSSNGPGYPLLLTPSPPPLQYVLAAGPEVVYNWNDGNPERKATIHVGGVAKTRETKWLGVVREVVFKNQIQGEHSYPPYLTHYLEGQAAGKPPSYNGE